MNLNSADVSTYRFTFYLGIKEKTLKENLQKNPLPGVFRIVAVQVDAFETVVLQVVQKPTALQRQKYLHFTQTTV